MSSWEPLELYKLDEQTRLVSCGRENWQARIGSGTSSRVRVSFGAGAVVIVSCPALLWEMGGRLGMT